MKIIMSLVQRQSLQGRIWSLRWHLNLSCHHPPTQIQTFLSFIMVLSSFLFENVEELTEEGLPFVILFHNHTTHRYSFRHDEFWYQNPLLFCILEVLHEKLYIVSTKSLWLLTLCQEFGVWTYTYFISYLPLKYRKLCPP